MSQPSTNSHPSSSSSKLHLKHKEYSEYPYRCIIFMDYKRTRERKKSLIQGTIKCDKKYYISFFLEHKTLESQPCHIFKQCVFLVMAAALWLRTVLMNCRWEIYKKEQGLIGFLPWERRGGNTSFHMIYSC
jgi:hypothetical protein